MSAIAEKPADLTERQWELLTFIWDSLCRDGFQPSFTELCTRFGIRSKNGIAAHLDALTRKGWIHRDFNRPRSIRFLRVPTTGEPFRGLAPL